ncbi:g8308 [Coccomyxa elongata]
MHFCKIKSVLEKAGFLGGDASSQLQVTLVDVPSNDWNKVADTFFKPGAVGCAGNILPSLVPKSFYAGEVAPAGSLHIGISVDALQWLSHAPPISLKDSITYVDGGPTHVEAFRRQFEGDAEHFLRLRAMEFGPGGLLMLVLPGTLGGRHICEGLLSCVSDAATELSAQGKIDASLLEDFIWPIYVPTEDELESIVNKAGYWEVLQRGGVSLTQMWDAYRESEDADAYAKVLTAIIFSAGGLLLRSRLAISEDTLQELRDKAEELVRKDPNKYVFRNIHVAVLLRRTRRRQSVDTGR